MLGETSIKPSQVRTMVSNAKFEVEKFDGTKTSACGNSKLWVFLVQQATSKCVNRCQYSKDGAKFKLKPNKKQSANHPKLPPNTKIDAKYIQDAQTKFFLS